MTSPNPKTLVIDDFKALWDNVAQAYGLGARLTYLVSDVHPRDLIRQSNSVDSLDLARLPEGSALFYVDNTCDASGTRCHISVRLEGDAGVPDLLADCKDVDLTVLHNYVVQSLQASSCDVRLSTNPTSNPPQAFRDQRAKPNCYFAVLVVNTGKSRSDEPFYQINVMGSVNTIVKSSSFPAQGDFTRPKWAPDFDGAMMARLLSESRPAKPCTLCTASTTNATASAGSSASMSTSKQVAILGGSLAAIVILAIIGVVVYEVMRRRATR